MRRVVCAFAASLLIVVVSGFSGVPGPVGNPDPGHRLLDAIRPVVKAVPGGATITRRTFDEPHWDSCDGVRSTYGWDPATVDVGFTPHGLSDAEVFGHIKTALAAQGWTIDAGTSQDGAWYWSRQVEGRDASIQLLAGDGGSDWDLQANAPPLAHPVTGC